ncbi:MAG: YfhO family protein, partial [Acidobacteria bacterium]|nr:YfhO family protein [Acidobacteriota bacterium]
IGGFLSAIQLLPEGEMLRFTERASITYNYFSQFSLAPRQFFNLLFPYYYGGAALGPYVVPYWGRWNLTETTGYVGMLTCLFTFAAIAMRRKSSVQWFWLAWAIIALTVSTGDNMPFQLNHVLHHIPVYKLFRAPGRHLMEFNFAVGLLAGFGVTALAQLEARARWRMATLSTAVLGLIVALAALLYGWFTKQLQMEMPLPPEAGALSNPDLYFPVVCFVLGVVALMLYTYRQNLLAAVVIVAVVVGDAMSFGLSYEWRLPTYDMAEKFSDSPSVKFIKEREPDLSSFRIVSHSPQPFGPNVELLDYPNNSILHGLHSVNGYDPMRLLRTTEITGNMTLEGVVENPEAFTPPHRGLDLLNVKYLLMERGTNDSIEIEGVRFSAEPERFICKPGLHSIFKTTATADELVLVSAMVNSLDLTTGTPVLEFKLTTADGRVIRHEMQAGRDTAEWAHDRPDTHAVVKHVRPNPIETWPEDGFQGHRYLTRFKFDRAQITQIEVNYLAPSADLTISRAVLFDSATKQSTALGDLSVSTERWEQLQQFGAVTLYQNKRWLPRAWFVKNWRVAPTAEVLQAVTTGKFADGTAFDPRATALVEREHYGETPASFPPASDQTNAEVRLTRYEPQRIDLQTRHTQAGLLVLSEIYYRGWDAYLDGQRIPVERVSYTLRGIVVPAGEHRIRFVFNSPSFRNGAVYSAVGLLLLLLGAVVQAKGSRTAQWLTRLADLGKRIKPSSLIMILVLAIYGGWLVRNAVYSVGGSDSTGYANLARALVSWDFSYTPELFKSLGLSQSYLNNFRPLGYVPTRQPGILAPFYSVGYSLHMAAGAILLGWKNGPFIINPLLAVFGIVLIYLLGMELGLSRIWAATGALLLSCHAVYLTYALHPMSDLPTAVWTLAAIWAALRTNRDEGSHLVAYALLAGASLGMVVLVRPMGIVLCLPVIIGLRANLRTWLFFLLGGLPLALFLFAFNYTAYGGPLTTGYSLEGIGEGLKLSYIPPRFLDYLYWLAVSMSPLPLLGWLVFLFTPQAALRHRWLIASWFVGLFLFYCCYLIYEGWFYLRFLLPAIPALILGFLLTMQRMQAWWEQRLPTVASRRLIRGSATLLCLIVWGVEIKMVMEHGVLGAQAEQYVNLRSVRWAHQKLPSNAVIISHEMSGALRFYTNRPILRWDHTFPQQWPMLTQQLTEKGWRFYALLMPHEVKDAQERLAGKWIDMGAYQHIRLWQVEVASAPQTR